MKTPLARHASPAAGDDGDASQLGIRADRGEKDPLRRLLLVAGALLYLAYALITPPFQTPDEHQHLFRAYQLAQFQLHGERRGSEAGGALPVGLVNAAAAELGDTAPHALRSLHKRPVAAMFRRHTELAQGEPRRFVNFVGGVLYSPVGYMPQIAAIWIGTALDWSVESILRAGRLFNAALALGLFAAALSILPVGRVFLVLLALMPMTAAVCASLGQDGLVLGICALLVAIGVRARVEARWTRNSLLLLGLCGAAIALTKIVYLPLLGVALFPFPNGARPLSWLGWPILLGLVGAALSACWLSANRGAVAPMGAGMAAPAEQLAHVLTHPADFASTLARTLVSRSKRVALTTFTFGWMAVGPILPAAGLAAVAFGFAFARSGRADAALSGWWRGWALLLTLVVALGIVTAIYLAGSPLGAPVVEGLQGRYFLPLLPLAYLAVMRRREAAAAGEIWLPFLPMLAANLLVLLAIGDAFYTF